jgi:RNA polymerase sigma-70 factor (ECF subfamily)
MERIEDFDAVLAAAQQGDDLAAARLYRAYAPYLFRYLRAREPRAADDLAGEVWMAVAQRLGAFEGDEDGFRAWLFSIARRQVAGHRRRGIRRRTDPVPSEHLEHAAADDVAELAATNVTAQEAVDLLVRHLTRDQAEVLLLRVVGDLDVTRTAEVMGRSETWVRTTQHRALRRLSRRLGGESPVTR